MEEQKEITVVISEDVSITESANSSTTVTSTPSDVPQTKINTAVPFLSTSEDGELQIDISKGINFIKKTHKREPSVDSSVKNKNDIPQQEEDDVNIVERGKTIIEQSKSVLHDVKSSDEAQHMLGEGKKLLDEVKQQEQVQQIIQEGSKIVSDIKKSEKGQELIAEGKEIVSQISQSEQFKQLKEQGLSLVEAVKDPSKKVEKEQLLQMVAHGKDLLKEIESEHSKEEVKKYVELAQTLLKETVQNNKEEGKSILTDFKSNNSDISQLIKEGESLVKDLKQNEDIKMLMSEGKEALVNALNREDPQQPLLSDDAKDLLSRGKTVLQSVATSDEAKSLAQKGKTLLESALNKDEVKGMILSGEKLFEDLKSSDKIHKLLENNKRFISDLKNVVVPFIQDQLLVMKIPPITGTKQTKVGNIDYTLSDVVFSGLTIPPSGVHVDFKDEIVIRVEEIQAEIKELKWRFKQLSFPFVKDDGLADAKVKDAKGIVGFKLTFEDHKPKVEITKLDFELSQLELKVNKASVTKIYNWLLGVFSDSVKSTVQTKLKDFLTTHVGNLTEKINQLAIQYWPQVKPSSQSNSVQDFQELIPETANNVAQDIPAVMTSVTEEEIVFEEQ